MGGDGAAWLFIAMRYAQLISLRNTTHALRRPISLPPIHPTAAHAHVQVSGVSGNLVPQPLGRNDGNLIADPLVGLKVQRELGVVALNDDLGGLLDGLGSDATHFGDLLCELGERLSWEGAVAVGLVRLSLKKSC